VWRRRKANPSPTFRWRLEETVMRISIIIGLVAFATVIGSALLAAFGHDANQSARDRPVPVTLDPTDLTRKAGPLPLQFYDAV
jgi:hypothetical protein